MAGDWIKMRNNLDSDPRVFAIAESLGLDDLHVVGLLWKVWAWADQHTLDGNDVMVSASRLDRIIGISGFADALRKVGWLEGRDQSLSFPRFSEHNGQTAKRRADGQARVAKHRCNNAPLQTKQTFPRGLKRKIKNRDNNTCVYCGRKEGELHPTESIDNGFICLDHVIPECQNGDTSEENLVCACMKCNRIKGDRNPEECSFKWPVDVTGKRYGSVTKALPEKRREEKSNTPSLSPAKTKKSDSNTNLPDPHPEWADHWTIWLESWEGREGRRVDPVKAQVQLGHLLSQDPKKSFDDLVLSIDRYSKRILDSDDDWSKSKASKTNSRTYGGKKCELDL